VPTGPYDPHGTLACGRGWRKFKPEDAATPIEEREGVAAEARALLEERPRTFSYLARPLDERFPGRNAFATGQTVCIRVYRAHCRGLKPCTDGHGQAFS
jgi:hypothetical protein